MFIILFSHHNNKVDTIIITFYFIFLDEELKPWEFKQLNYYVAHDVYISVKIKFSCK